MKIWSLEGSLVTRMAVEREEESISGGDHIGGNECWYLCGLS